MEKRSRIPGRGWGGIAVFSCERLLGSDGRYNDSLRILGRQRSLPHIRPRPSHVRPPPPPPLFAVVVVVIVIAIVVPSAHLSSSLSPPPNVVPPDAT